MRHGLIVQTYHGLIVQTYHGTSLQVLMTNESVMINEITKQWSNRINNNYSIAIDVKSEIPGQANE